MRIVKAKLFNFRRFTNTEIPFDTSIIALVGKNNSGKSSILEVLAIMLQAQTGPMSLSRKAGNGGRIVIELHLQFNEQEWSEIVGSMESSHISYAHKDIDLKTLIPKFVKTSLIYKWSADMRDGVENNPSRTICFDNITLPSDFPDACKNVDTLVSPIILGQKNLSSLTGLLYIPSEPQTSEVEKFIPFSELTKSSDRTNFIRNNLYHLMKSEPDNYDYLVKRLSSILENILEIDTKHNEDTGNIDLKLSQGNYRTDFSEMGSGTKTVLTILCRLVSSKTTIALLDEPDKHLHPGLVRELAEFIKEISKVVQVIICSHNTTFIDVIDRQSILHVYATSSITSTVSPLTKDDGILEILDDLDVHIGNFGLSEVRQSKVLILGEGPTDWYYIQHLAKKAGYLERIMSLRPKYLDLGGGKILRSELLDRMNGSRLPFILIRDKDESNANQQSKLIRKLGNDRCHFLSRREIENYALDYRSLLKTLKDKAKSKGEITRKKIDALTEQVIKNTIKALAEDLKPKVILLRFVNSLPILEIYHYDEIHDFVDRNREKNSDEIVDEVSLQLLNKLTHFDKQKLKEIILLQNKEVEAEWTESGILKICPGKDLLKLINKWSMQEFGISINVSDLIQNLEQIDDDITVLCQKIINAKT